MCLVYIAQDDIRRGIYCSPIPVAICGGKAAFFLFTVFVFGGSWLFGILLDFSRFWGSDKNVLLFLRELVEISKR